MMQLDGNGLNLAISSSVLSEEEMRKLGFTDHSGDSWYLCSSVERDVTLNVTIPKDGSRLRIDVLDEQFGQPYDYQRLLKRDPSLNFAITVKARVENMMELLSSAGVIQGYRRGIYI